MILEVDSSDLDIPNLLTKHGYKLFEIDRYIPYEPTPDISRLVNILAINEKQTNRCEFFEGIEREAFVEATSDDWREDEESRFLYFMRVKPGRYIFSYDATDGAYEDHSEAEIWLIGGEPFHKIGLPPKFWSILRVRVFGYFALEGARYGEKTLHP